MMRIFLNDDADDDDDLTAMVFYYINSLRWFIVPFYVDRMLQIKKREIVNSDYGHIEDMEEVER